MKGFEFSKQKKSIKIKKFNAYTLNLVQKRIRRVNREKKMIEYKSKLKHWNIGIKLK